MNVILHLVRILYMGHVRKVSQPMKKLSAAFVTGPGSSQLPNLDTYKYNYLDINNYIHIYF